MLYYLLYQRLFPVVRPFRLFGFVTFRTAFASLTALFLCMVLGPWLIDKLREFQIGQHIREDGPKSHQKKEGTPTMGGVLIIISVVIPTLLWADLRDSYIWVALLGLVGYGVIGFWDDYAKLMRGKNLGLTVKQKLGAQILLGLVLAGILLAMHERGVYNTNVNIPFLKQYKPDLLIDSWMTNPWTYPLGVLPFFAFVTLIAVGFSNAVNLTDGLDGLAIGLMVVSSGALTILTYTSGHAIFANYLGLDTNSRVAELTIFCGALTGASLGFLWYNAHPAEIFMGDVGSLSLGGGMAVVAVLIKQEVLLLFIGGVFVVETLSVILQVGSYKLRGKRIFKMAPLHHHFEQLGWQESKIIARFWIAGLVMALFALTTLKLR
jgi:phospho-N-acetylmuramoyl-pentapeptide-transferase